MSKADDKVKTSRSGHGAGQRAGEMFAFGPFDYTIIGIDTPHKSKAEHPRWDPRIRLPLSETMIRNIRHRGVIVPVIFERDGNMQVIVEGIQRIRNAREAVLRQREAGEIELKVRGYPVSGSDAQYGYDQVVVIARRHPVWSGGSGFENVTTYGRAASAFAHGHICADCYAKPYPVAAAPQPKRKSRARMPCCAYAMGVEGGEIRARRKRYP